MKEFIKKNIIVILAFLLPITLIIVVALSAYIPSLFVSTDYNFIYSSCNIPSDYYPYQCDNYLQNRFSVVNNKLVVNPIDPNQDSDKDGVRDIKENYNARIFLHNTEKNESREITIEEAQNLSLNNLLTSPDGITVSTYYDRGADFFPFFGSNSSYGHYLIKGNGKSKLNLINHDDRYYYRNNFQFIGWILQ